MTRLKHHCVLKTVESFPIIFIVLSNWEHSERKKKKTQAFALCRHILYTKIHSAVVFVINARQFCCCCYCLFMSLLKEMEQSNFIGNAINSDLVAFNCAG